MEVTAEINGSITVLYLFVPFSVQNQIFIIIIISSFMLFRSTTHLPFFFCI